MPPNPTPRPWTFGTTFENRDDLSARYIRDGNGFAMALANDSESARLIVLAVNSHDALTQENARLREIESAARIMMEEWERPAHAGWSDRLGACMDRLQAALSPSPTERRET